MDKRRFFIDIRGEIAKQWKYSKRSRNMWIINVFRFRINNTNYKT